MEYSKPSLTFEQQADQLISGEINMNPNEITAIASKELCYDLPRRNHV